MPQFKPFSDFGSAATESLKFLHDRFGFGLWMVTRTEGQDWIVLYAEDHKYGVKNGAVFRWTDSFCSRMVDGHGPCVAPDSDHIPAYKEAPIGTQVPIGAYIGIPLRDADGELFGTLCAIDPSPQDPSLEKELPLIRLIGRLLSTCIANELKANTQQSTQLKTKLRSMDAMVEKGTGAFLPEAWSKIASAEEARCQQFGSTAYVLRLQIEAEPASNANTVLKIVDTAKDLLGGSHIIARPNRNEFLFLLPDVGREEGDQMKELFECRLNDLPLKIKSAVRDPRRNLQDAIQETMFV
jgi:diguanylate cyclase